MAVQKSRKSKAKRNMRRSANFKTDIPNLSFDKSLEEFHLRHFVSPSGYYRGKKIFNLKEKKSKQKE